MTNDSETKAAGTGTNPEIEALLAPIPGDNPVGTSLRYEGTYDAVQEARREDDPSLPQGVWKTSLKTADWDDVEALCTDALSSRSKDLQLAAWLTEAWTRLRGYAGAAAGLELLTGLCQRYWKDLYPAIDGDDYDGRVAPFEWLNNRLMLALKAVPITESGSATWIDWEDALREENQQSRAPSPDDGDEADERSRRSAKQEITGHILATPTTFYSSMRRNLQGAKQSLAALHAELVERCGLQAPSGAQIEEFIDSAGHFVERILREREAMDDTPTSAPIDDQATAAEDATHQEIDATPLPSGPIKNRAEAYQMLAAASDYLARIEPHSPTPYLVRRAISWGSMSLADLLRELLRDNADLPTVYSLLGIRQGESYED